MVQVDKFVKSINSKNSKNSKTRIRNLISKAIKIQAKHTKAIKKKVINPTVSKSRSNTSNHDKIISKYIKKIGIDIVSSIPISQKLTKLDMIESLIIQPDIINIPTMKSTKKTKLQVLPKQPQPSIKQQSIKQPSIKQPQPSIKQTILQDYIIVIPSYNRPDIIQVKTLALLYQHNINIKKINIFVANQEQYDIYKAKVPAFLYDKIEIGVVGLKNQRNFIMDYYPEGTCIVQMDDDLDKIVELVVSKKTSQSRKSQSRQDIKSTRPITNLDSFITNAFKLCKEKEIFLWGVYPLSNPHFMTPTTTTDLRFIVGPMWGIINRHLPDLKLTIDEKENTERTLQHWVIDHKVLRFNNIGIETKYYKNKGGMQNEGKNRKEEALKSVYYLNKKYPKLTKIYLGKKSGMPELRLKNSNA